MNTIYRRNLQMLIIGKVVIETFHVRFHDLHYALFSKGRHDKHLIHVNVVLKGTVLNAAFKFFPKVVSSRGTVVSRIRSTFAFAVCRDRILSLAFR